ncbi:hypothetical protein GEMRC1_014115 [Eukaryota sp. GEM-RC1]
MGQCSQPWHSDIMVTKTICQVGCLMTSIASGLNGHDISISGSSSNPRTLNQYLRHHGGYVQGQLLVYAAVTKINPGRLSYVGSYNGQGSLSTSTLKNYLDAKSYIIVGQVRSGGHYVLIDGYSSDLINFHVMDPGYILDSYTYASNHWI